VVDVKNISLYDALTNLLHSTSCCFISSTHLQGHHDIVLRATNSDLRRLLKGAEEKSNQDLEVLRGSERFLKGCDNDRDCENGKCDIKTGETEGDCKCDKGYEGDKCEDQVQVDEKEGSGGGDKNVDRSSLSAADSAALDCLVDDSDDILRDTKKENGLEENLNVLLSECAVADSYKSCIETCNTKIESDCKDELKDEGENDCGGIHDKLKKCYKDCFGL
jgi:hypothetical protein